MILLTILFIMLAFLTVVTVLSIAVGGVAFIVVFADLIIFIVVLVWIIKHLICKKHKKK